MDSDVANLREQHAAEQRCGRQQSVALHGDSRIVAIVIDASIAHTEATADEHVQLGRAEATDSELAAHHPATHLEVAPFAHLDGRLERRRRWW